jgi:hypothetical protein
LSGGPPRCGDDVDDITVLVTDSGLPFGFGMTVSKLPCHTSNHRADTGDVGCLVIQAGQSGHVDPNVQQPSTTIRRVRAEKQVDSDIST